MGAWKVLVIQDIPFRCLLWEREWLREIRGGLDNAWDSGEIQYLSLPLLVVVSRWGLGVCPALLLLP